MTGRSFLRDVFRGGLANAFGQTGGLTGLGPKFSYDATKGFVGSNPIVGGYAGQVAGGDFGRQAGSFPSGIGSAVGSAMERMPREWPPEEVGGVGSSLGKGVVRGGNPFAGGLLNNFFK